LNPAVHFDTLKTSRKGIPCPKNSKILRVNILGVPNSGKSTLINQLTGFNICAHSPKVHTTRRNARAILTENDTQVKLTENDNL
jgi:GTPase Era involved in 16S rRNA processing